MCAVVPLHRVLPRRVGRVGPDPGDPVDGAAADLPAAGPRFEPQRAAAGVEGEVDGAEGAAVRAVRLGDVAPAGRAGGAAEPLLAEQDVVMGVVERVTAVGHGLKPTWGPRRRVGPVCRATSCAPLASGSRVVQERTARRGGPSYGEAATRRRFHRVRRVQGAVAPQGGLPAVCRLAPGGRPGAGDRDQAVRAVAPDGAGREPGRLRQDRPGEHLPGRAALPVGPLDGPAAHGGTAGVTRGRT